MKMRRLARLALLLAPAIAFAGPKDDAKNLLEKGSSSAAAEILENSLEKNLADAEYNYLLGIALLDSGSPGKAVLAFERTLAIEPTHGPARAELGRALAALGEYEAARAELQQAKTAAIPQDAAKRVEQTISALDLAIEQRARSADSIAFAGYLEGEFGYDTNIGSATNDTSVIVLGVPFRLSGVATAQASWVLGVNGGIAAQKRVAADVSLFGSIDGRFRYHLNQDEFAPGYISAAGGVQVVRGADRVSVGVMQGSQYVGGLRTDGSTGVFGQWQRDLGKQDVVAMFGQIARLDHPVVPALNTDLYLLGGSWTHAYLTSGDPRMTLTAWMGDDSERASNNPSAGRSLVGVKVAGEYLLRENWKLFGSLSSQSSRYGGLAPLTTVRRSDMRNDLSLGAAYKFDRNWTFTSQYSFARNDSNVAINDYKREVLMFTARRDFY